MDTIPLPDDLKFNRALYRGTWKSEARENEIRTDRRGNVHSRLRRDIWITLPSGKDLKVVANAGFSGLPGHRVGIVRCEATGWLVAAVNYDTGEKGVFYRPSGRRMLGSAVILGIVLHLAYNWAFRSSAPMTNTAIWLGGLALALWLVWRAYAGPKEEGEQEGRRLQILLEAGP